MINQDKNFKWEGTHLNNLLNMNIDELCIEYPEKTKKNLERRKQEYLKRVREHVAVNESRNEPKAPLVDEKLSQFEKLLQRSNIDPSQVGRINRMNVWQSAKKGEDDEWDVQDLYGMQITPVDNVEARSFEPVKPANIRPTKRRPQNRQAKYILAYGDGQVDYRRIIHPVTDETTLVPLHNLAAHNIIKQLNAEYQPETTVNLGDFADMAALSRFAPDSDHFHKTLGPSMRYIHDFYAQMVADNPEAKHVEVDSNHAVRIKKQVLANLPALHDYVRPGEDSNYPMMTYYYLANLGKLNINFVSGYGAAEFVYGEESGNPIVFKHGTHSSSSVGATVRKEAMENPTVNVIRGHGHDHEVVRNTTRGGKQLFYIQLGSSCMNTGAVPGYHSAVDDFNKPVHVQLNHQNTIAIIEDFGGVYTVHPIDIQDGKAYFNGKVYDGNE